MSLPPFSYIEARDVAEAATELRVNGDAVLIGGGTVVVPMLRHQLLRPTRLVSIVTIPGMDLIAQDDDHTLTIGALATHRRIAESSMVRRYAPLLASACAKVATPTIRSMGTLGGNLAYGESASDPPAALLALNATIHLVGCDGARTVPVRTWFTGFYSTVRSLDEIVVKIDIPRPPEDAIVRYLKWTPRSRDDKPLVGLALMLRIIDGVCMEVSMAVSGIAETPVMLGATSAILEGSELNRSTIEGVAEVASTEVEPIEDLQGSAEYRRSMLRVWTARMLEGLREDLAR